MKLTSLRARLILIILVPLLLIAVLAAYWQIRTETQRAEEIFDRGLLSAALAISRDVAVSGGDALSPATRKLITDTSGGEVFYHVYAPDGAFVTGYATPPVIPQNTSNDLSAPLYYDARYQSQSVRVLRFKDLATVDGLTGVSTVTVWQNMSVRQDFARDVASRAVLVIALLVASVALVVWFGVRLGLRPLLDLEDAIARRSDSELEPIRRPVPVEAQGLVATLNLLLDRVSRRISSKDEFISNAAHQLRNPIAGVLALAEAVESAPNAQASKSRSKELVSAARDVSHLTNQLLSFERARGTDTTTNDAPLDLVQLVDQVVAKFAPPASARGVALDYEPPYHPVMLLGDRIMLQEALLNVLTNCLVHGGPDLGRIALSVQTGANEVVIKLRDDGIGIDPTLHAAAAARFSQANAGPGSGLGLPIALRVAQNHGGRLQIRDCAEGALIEMTLPILRDHGGEREAVQEFEPGTARTRKTR